MAGIKRADCVFDSISIEGEWWLPDTPTIKVRGTVSGRIAGDLHLSTEGNLGDDFHKRESNMIILGESRTGERFTLLQCFATKRISGFDWSQADGTYFAHWLLVGEHFRKYADLLFDRISFGVSNLEEWHDAKPFDFQLDHKEGVTSVTYSKPNSVTILDDEQFIATLEFTYRPSSMCVAQKSATIEHAARINLKSKAAPMPLYEYDEDVLDSFLGHMQRIESFVQFAIGTSVFPYDIKAFSSKFPEPSDPQYSRPIEICRVLQVPSNPEPIHFHKMLFTWKRIEDDPQKYFQAWASKLSEIGMPVWMYLGSFREQVYEDQRFMELAQALEGYHRYRFPEKPEKTSEHEGKLEQILEGCPGVHQEWLATKLAYSHEPSLRSRLKELVEVQKDIATWLAGSWKNAKDFIGQIVNNRNQHAHCLDDGKTFTGLHRNRTIRVMQAMLAMLLLKEAGFSDEQVEKIIKNNWGYSQLQKCLTEEAESNNQQNGDGRPSSTKQSGDTSSTASD